MFKKILFKVLFILLTFTAILALSSCKKDGSGTDGSTDDGKAKIYIVTKENYEKALKKDYKGDIDSFDEYLFSEVSEITELDTYYAVVRIPSNELEKARLTVGGDIKVMYSINLGGPKVFKAEYNRNENSYYIKKLSAEDNIYDFYATVCFTVSQDYSGKPADIKFEYSSDGEGEEYKSCVEAKKDIRITRKADTVSSIGFLTESDYQSGDYEDKIQERIEIAADEKCYAVIDYTLTNEIEIKETDTAELKVFISPSTGIEYEIGVEALPTTNYSIRDGELSAKFKIHDGIGDGKKFRFIICFSAGATKSFTVASNIFGNGVFFVGGYRATGTVRVNADLVRESKLEYTISSDGSYYAVTGLGSEYSDTVTIPSVYKNLPVKEIDSFVFMGANHIKKVILTEGLEKIGEGAFKNCMSLESVIIPLSVTEIGDGAFAGGNADICCVAAEKPEGWSDTWIESDREVTWNCSKLYALNKDGRSYSFGLGELKLTDVKILPKYNYLPVTAITDGAFASSGIKKVTNLKL